MSRMVQPSSTVYHDLRTSILQGTYGAGSWLREGSVAADLGVSRTPVREALRRLHADGLVELIPNRGAQVVRVSDADLQDTYDLRALLEGYAARRAAANPAVDTDALRALCTEMEQRLTQEGGPAFGEITRLNMKFHRDIQEAACNAMLPSLLSGIVQVAVVRHTFHHYTPTELGRSFSQHREIVDAIETGDGAWAEAVMSAHILGARASLKRRLAEITQHELEAGEVE